MESFDENLASPFDDMGNVSSALSIPCPDTSAASPSAFCRLPPEIIEQILYDVDPSSFASLALLNTTWRSISQTANLYAHHLAKCPSFAAKRRSFAVNGVSDDDLPNLRRLFAQEVKRNLFPAFLRPRKTVITLVSNSLNPTSCLVNSGLQFTSSHRGKHLVAFNSGRVYVLDASGPEPKVTRELKILRRPQAVCINDSCSLLAVLSTQPVRVNIYNLEKQPATRTQSLILTHRPRSIALSPCGNVLAAAYNGYIEVSSLRPGALATDRRVVKCDAVDELAFSLDGSQLIGTTVNADSSNTVVITVPVYDVGGFRADVCLDALWTTSILFPSTSRDCSHAVLLQDSSFEGAYWTIAYDRSYETFRAVYVDDLRNGTTYFTRPDQLSLARPMLPCTLPDATHDGDVFCAGFERKEVWIYGIPEDLDALAPSQDASKHVNNVSTGASSPRHSSLSRRPSAMSATRGSRVLSESTNSRPAQWQMLSDKLRHTFVPGVKITSLDGVSLVKWVADNSTRPSLSERLVIAAPGIDSQEQLGEADSDYLDGGRIMLLDFDYGLDDGKTNHMVINVGIEEPEVLGEERLDLATEVALAQRKTLGQRPNKPVTLCLSTSTSHASPVLASSVTNDQLISSPSRRTSRIMATNSADVTTTVQEEQEEQDFLDEQDALDAPYSHASPRSRTTLRRAATAVAMRRDRHSSTGPASVATGRQYEYRRADGRLEHPHESDADNWVPPPPPYQKDDPNDAPVFLRNAVFKKNGVLCVNERLLGRQPSVPPTPPLSTAFCSATDQQQVGQSSVQHRAQSSSVTLQNSRSLAMSAARLDTVNTGLSPGACAASLVVDSASGSHNTREMMEIRRNGNSIQPPSAPMHTSPAFSASIFNHNRGGSDAAHSRRRSLSTTSLVAPLMISSPTTTPRPYTSPACEEWPPLIVSDALGVRGGQDVISHRTDVDWSKDAEARSMDVNGIPSHAVPIVAPVPQRTAQSTSRATFGNSSNNHHSRASSSASVTTADTFIFSKAPPGTAQRLEMLSRAPDTAEADEELETQGPRENQKRRRRSSLVPESSGADVSTSANMGPWMRDDLAVSAPSLILSANPTSNSRIPSTHPASSCDTHPTAASTFPLLQQQQQPKQKQKQKHVNDGKESSTRKFFRRLSMVRSRSRSRDAKYSKAEAKQCTSSVATAAVGAPDHGLNQASYNGKGKGKARARQVDGGDGCGYIRDEDEEFIPPVPHIPFALRAQPTPPPALPACATLRPASHENYKSPLPTTKPESIGCPTLPTLSAKADVNLDVGDGVEVEQRCESGRKTTGTISDDSQEEQQAVIPREKKPGAVLPAGQKVEKTEKNRKLQNKCSIM